MFSVLILFSGLMYGATALGAGGWGGSYPGMGAYSMGGHNPWSMYSQQSAPWSSKGHIVPMPYPYPYSYGGQSQGPAILVRSGGRRRSGGFGFGGGLIGLLIGLALLMAVFPMLFMGINNNNAVRTGATLGFLGKK